MNDTITEVDTSNIMQAAVVHAASWQASHRDFCSPAFVARHTPERQQAYLESKIAEGSRFFLLLANEPVGIVSVTVSLIADLYVLPARQNKGYGTALLRYAITQCTGTPTLWILENNTGAQRLYHKLGFRETGAVRIEGKLKEIELALSDTNHP